MRIVCEYCGRAILPGKGVPDAYVTFGPVKRLWGEKYVCGPCGHELDEDGLYPEERDEVLSLFRGNHPNGHP